MLSKLSKWWYELEPEISRHWYTRLPMKCAASFLVCLPIAVIATRLLSGYWLPIVAIPLEIACSVFVLNNLFVTDWCD